MVTVMIRPRRGSKFRQLEQDVGALRSSVDSLRRDVELLRESWVPSSREDAVIVVREMSKEEIRARVLEIFDRGVTTDIAELHRLIGCDVGNLNEVLNQLIAEGHIEEA